MSRFNRGQWTVIGIGFLLIVLGVGFIFLQVAGSSGVGVWVPVIAGVIILALAVASRLQSFFLIGCLLSAGGGGVLWYSYATPSNAQNLAGSVFLIFLSVGFLASTLLTRWLCEKAILWPLIPGAAGLVTGVVLLL